MAKIKFSWRTEIVGGLAVFLAMSYVLLANPRILGAIPDRVIDGVSYAGPDPGVVFASTCLLAGILSIAIGVRAWSPSAIACGMGLNSLMATFAGPDLGFNWQYLLVFNFVVGLIVLAMSSSEGRGAKSLRDKLLRDPEFLPTSLTSVVEASVAGMLAGIAYKMVLADQGLVSQVSSETPAFASGDLLLPFAVGSIALVSLLFVNLIASAVAHNLDNIAGKARGLARGFWLLLSWIVRLINSVKIIAGALLVAFIFEQLYGWSGIARDLITDIRFALPPIPHGPINFNVEWRESISLAVIYAGTVAFVLLFDISGNPHQMLSEDPPPSVVKQGDGAVGAWGTNREERVRRGFWWEAFGNLLAPFLSVSPVTCYGENNVVRDVGDEPNDGARTGIPAIMAGLLFLGALGYAFWRPAEVQYWINALPGTAIALMLAWISVVIGLAVARTVGGGAHGADQDNPIVRFELLAAGLASLAASFWQGLALGLCIGILAVFAVRLVGMFIMKGVKVQNALYALATLAFLALLGQIFTIAPSS